MKRVLEISLKVLSKIPLLVVVLLALGMGYMFRGAAAPPPAGVGSASDQGEVADEPEEIWTCSMHPQIREPKPGKCPICGMTLVLADTPAKTAKRPAKAEKKPKYACAMFCVPPMEQPGKCPICGMDMVEVEAGEAGDGESDGRTLKLSPAARKLAEVQSAPVQRKFVQAEVRMVGKVDFDETRVRHITAWVAGRLDRLYVDYTGVPVQKGEHLVYLYSPELVNAQVELLEGLKAAKEVESSDVDIVRDISRRLVDDTREKLRLWGLTDEQIAAIEARGKPTDHMTIYAPMGGIVIDKHVAEGMYVQTGTRIYTIADLSRVWVKLDAYESDLVWLRYGQAVEFETEAYPGEPFTGTIAFIDPVLTARTRTVKVRVNVDNANGRLKPGMFVRALARSKIAAGGRVIDAELAGKWIGPMHPEIVKDEPGACDVCGMPLVRAETLGVVESGQAEPPLVVPASAPLITGKRAVVYVELPGEPGRYQGREIVLGPRAGDYYLVREGLAEGERVVVNGNFKIDSAVQIMAKPSMMSPETGEEKPEKPETPAEQPPAAGRSFAVPQAFRVGLSSVMGAYLEIQQALSHDQFEKAREAAKRMGNALDGVEMGLLSGAAHGAWMREAKGIAKSASAIAAAGDVEKARSHFALLSETMIVVAQCLGPGTRTVHRFRCPMAFNDRGADWLQAGEETENPYFGSVMFRCGVIEQTIEAVDPETEDDPEPTTAPASRPATTRSGRTRPTTSPAEASDAEGDGDE